jgi:Zn-dependent peptidase ImmA (M78 family)
LKAAGLQKKYVKDVVLPEWWKDEIAKEPAGFAEAIGYLSQHLGLDLRLLRNQEAEIEWPSSNGVLYKRRGNVAESDLAIAQAIATRAAKIALHATRGEAAGFPESAGRIREEILSGEKRPVELGDLLAYCWDRGVPVLHVSRFPTGAKKPDGLVAIIDGRPVIVLSLNRRHSAWQAFLLGHEMGHIAKRHVRDGRVLVDVKVDDKSSAALEVAEDEQESEANAFAAELLTGQPDKRYLARIAPNAERLAAQARSIGKRDGVDPGVIALNFAWNKGYWPLGNAALKLLELKPDAIGTIRRMMLERLDLDRLPDESRDFLLRVTGA